MGSTALFEVMLEAMLDGDSGGDVELMAGPSAAYLPDLSEFGSDFRSGCGCIVSTLSGRSAFSDVSAPWSAGLLQLQLSGPLTWLVGGIRL